MFYLTALTTLATVQFYGWLGYRVGRARMTYGVPAPATTGDPTFERHYRIQMNTLEWLPIQLVGLWMFAIYVSDLGAAVLGVIWIVGRALYARAYLADPKTPHHRFRHPVRGEHAAVPRRDRRHFCAAGFGGLDTGRSARARRCGDSRLKDETATRYRRRGSWRWNS